MHVFKESSWSDGRRCVRADAVCADNVIGADKASSGAADVVGATWRASNASGSDDGGIDTDIAASNTSGGKWVTAIDRSICTISSTISYAASYALAKNVSGDVAAATASSAALDASSSSAVAAGSGASADTWTPYAREGAADACPNAADAC